MENYMFWRNIWLWSIFSLGTFNTAYYYGESIYTNSLSLSLLPALFVSYVCWDTYIMLDYDKIYSNVTLIRHVIYTDLYYYLIYNNAWYTASLLTICVNVHLFDYWMAPVSNRRYKLLIILFVRIPFWILFACLPFIDNEYADHLYFTFIASAIFIGYDLFLVKKTIHKIYKSSLSV